jgi:hypothetical protein
MDFEKLPRFKMNALEIVCKVPEWSEIFKVEPQEIERQIGWAHGWCDCNKARAPKRNVMRFIYNWLCIAQRKGSFLKQPRKNFKEADWTPDMTFEEMVEIRRRNMPQRGTKAEEFKDAIPTEAINDAH